MTSREPLAALAWRLVDLWIMLVSREGRRYLWARPSGSCYLEGPFVRLRLAWCRYRGHPAGIIFYNAGGYEPDTRCKNCGDYIG